MGFMFSCHVGIVSYVRCSSNEFFRDVQASPVNVSEVHNAKNSKRTGFEISLDGPGWTELTISLN